MTFPRATPIGGLRGTVIRPGAYGRRSNPVRSNGSVLGGTSFSSNEDFFETPGSRILMDGAHPVLANGDPDYFTELENIRTGRTETANNRLASYGSELTDNLGAYETASGNLISGLEGRLGGVNRDFENRSAAEILEDERARRRLRSSYAKASRLGADMAIADGTRSAKAMFANRGGGGSSYADRLAIGLRMKAEADAAGRMSDLERDDHAAVTDARSRLRSTLFGANRGDLGTVFGERSRLAGNIFDARRANTGAVYGEGSRINGVDAATERENLFRTREIRPINAPLGPAPTPMLTYRTGRRGSRLFM